MAEMSEIKERPCALASIRERRDEQEAKIYRGEEFKFVSKLTNVKRRSV